MLPIHLLLEKPWKVSWGLRFPPRRQPLFSLFRGLRSDFLRAMPTFQLFRREGRGAIGDPDGRFPPLRVRGLVGQTRRLLKTELVTGLTLGARRRRAAARIWGGSSRCFRHDPPVSGIASNKPQPEADGLINPPPRLPQKVSPRLGMETADCTISSKTEGCLPFNWFRQVTKNSSHTSSLNLGEELSYTGEH